MSELRDSRRRRLRRLRRPNRRAARGRAALDADRRGAFVAPRRGFRSRARGRERELEAGGVRPRRGRRGAARCARARRRRRCERAVSRLRRRALRLDRGVHRGAHSLSRSRRRLGLRRRRRRVGCAGARRRRVLPGGCVELPRVDGGRGSALAQGLQRVDTIRAGIAPSPFARRRRERHSRDRELRRAARAAAPERRGERGVAFTEQLRFTIAPPGRVPLHNTAVLARRRAGPARARELWPEVESVWMGAAPVPRFCIAR